MLHLDLNWTWTWELCFTFNINLLQVYRYFTLPRNIRTLVIIIVSNFVLSLLNQGTEVPNLLTSWSCIVPLPYSWRTRILFLLYVIHIAVLQFSWKQEVEVYLHVPNFFMLKNHTLALNFSWIPIIPSCCSFYSQYYIPTWY